MMNTSTKLITFGAASLLGVALAAGAAHAATWSTSAADAPGQVLHVTGVGPASAQSTATATATATPNAKALSGATAARATTVPPTPRGATHAKAPSSVRQVARPAPQMLPAYHEVMHSGETAHGSTNLNGASGAMR